ncbi:hypothetical protein [Trinickia sp.]|uniref:hypothetical protein n=1 Tax=Trinickia sp. TaxID=2571163 RepID=UPI003F8048E5
MTNFRLSGAIAIALLICACSEQPSGIWVAAKATPVYASNDDAETRTLFTLRPGDACTPLRMIEMKVYQHTEIECEKGRGWVTGKHNFNIKAAA